MGVALRERRTEWSGVFTQPEAVAIQVLDPEELRIVYRAKPKIDGVTAGSDQVLRLSERVVATIRTVKIEALLTVLAHPFQELRCHYPGSWSPGDALNQKASTDHSIT
jgi:hypothetical protein